MTDNRESTDNQALATVPALSCEDLARALGISRRAVAFRIQNERYAGAGMQCGPDGRPRLMVPIAALSDEERALVTGAPASTESVQQIAGLPAGTITAVEQAVGALRLDNEGLRPRLLELARRRLALLVEWQGLPRRRDEQAVSAIGARWAASDRELAGAFPDLARPADYYVFYRAAKAVAAGDAGAILGRVQPRLETRGSKRLGDGEARMLTLLTELLWDSPTTIPVASVIRVLAIRARRENLPAAPDRWVRDQVAAFRRDELAQVMLKEGTRGVNLKGAYSPMDKTTILPGDEYVADNRQFDVEVIGSDGSLIRPWQVLIVDHRTLMPVSYVFSEASPTGDTVLTGIIGSFMQKEPNERNAPAGAALQFLCGLPKVFVFDNGKDYCNSRIDGRQVRDAAGEIERVAGVMEEMGVRVRHALPYNGKGKIVERVFGDISRAHDVLCPGYVGNKPGQVEQRTRDMRERYARARKAMSDAEAATLEGRQRLAKASGHMLREDFEAQWEAWIWQWSVREDSRAQGLQHEGKRMSAPALYAALCDRNRIVPDELQLQLLSMQMVSRQVDRGTIRLHGRLYFAAELLALSGRTVNVRHFRHRHDFVVVDQVVGEAALPVRIQASLHTGAAADGTGSAEAIEALRHAQKLDRTRLRDQVADVPGSAIADIVAEGMATAAQNGGRGEATSVNGVTIRRVLSVMDSKAVPAANAVPADEPEDDMDIWVRRRA